MRILLITIGLLLTAGAAHASQAAMLTEGQSKLAAGDSLAAEELFQRIVEAADAEPAEVEEALFWQLMIYSGDFLSAMALLSPLQTAHPDNHQLKRRIAQQMGLSRWAFFVASGNYLNSTALGGSLAGLQVNLPALTTADVDLLRSTLGNPEILKQILTDYETDPAVAEGLVLRTNQYSMYLAVAEAVPGLSEATIEQIGGRMNSGVTFNQLHFFDWMARVAQDMDGLVNEENGPDLKDIQQRCDQRIIKLAGNDVTNKYAVEALARSGH